VPQKLVRTVEAPVQYPARLHDVLECCLLRVDQWQDVLTGVTEKEAREMHRKINTFAKSWHEHPRYDPRMLERLTAKKIVGRVVPAFGAWAVQMRIREKLLIGWENILQSSSKTS